MNLSTAFIYISLIAISAILMFSTIHKNSISKTALFYRIYNILQICWLILKILSFVVFDNEAVKIIAYLEIAFSICIPLVILLLMISFYKISLKWLKRTAYMLFIFPILTVFFALAPRFHFLFQMNLDSPAALAVYLRGIGFWHIINLLLLFICWLVIAAVTLSQYWKMPKAYHSGVNLLVCAWLVSILGLVADRLLGKDMIDLYLLGIVIGNLICYIAISGNGRMDYWNIWQRDVFDYLDEAIILVDKNGIVVEANEPANNLAKGVISSLEGMDIRSMSAQPIASGLLEVRPVFGENGQIVGSDIYIMTGMHPMIYQFRRRPFPRTYGNMGGEFFTITDVTRNRLTMERVREVAGIDPLTGIHNRFSYEQTLKQMDISQSLPLSVISIDANNLKTINDTLGHEAGDRFLCQIAEILREHSGQGSYVARIGGDEFIILLKNCSEAQAQQRVCHLLEAAENAGDLPYPFSFAAGCATKESLKENIDTVIRKADEFMYKNKRERVSI